MKQSANSTTSVTDAGAPQDDQAPPISMNLLAEHNRWHHGGLQRGTCGECGGCRVCGAADARLTRPGRCVCALREGQRNGERSPGRSKFSSGRAKEADSLTNGGPR